MAAATALGWRSEAFRGEPAPPRLGTALTALRAGEANTCELRRVAAPVAKLAVLMVVLAAICRSAVAAAALAAYSPPLR